MGRLSDELIERVKREISLVDLVERQGHVLNPHGVKDRVMLCPFQPEKTPSLVITPSENLWHCMGCGAGGSVIDWVMRTEGVSFRHAVELLTQSSSLAAASAAKGKTSAKRSTAPKLENPVDAEDTQAALAQVIDYYHETLKQSPEALEYLEKRGLNDPVLIEHFKLGYANRTLGYRLPQKNRKAGAALRGQLQSLGIIRASGHEHFNGSLVIPVINTEDELTEVYGRKLLDNLRKGTPKHLYLPGPHRGVFNEAGLTDTKEVILCEALLDALTFWVHGFKHVTSSYGTSGFTEEILTAFETHGIERVLIAYDRDTAGDEAAVQVAKKLNAAGIDAFRVQFPKGMDANAYALKLTPAAQSLGLAIRKAEWMGQGAAPKVETAAKAELDEDSTLAAPSESPALPSETDEPAAIDTASTPVPEIPNLPEATVTEHEIHVTLGDRHYRVRGLALTPASDQMKVNLLVRMNEAFHTDRFDLYAAKQRAVFMHQAAAELGCSEEIIKTDLGQVLLKLETIQDAERTAEPLTQNEPLSEQDREVALALLRDPNLAERLCADLTTAGLVGEDTNKLTAYLACVSRLLDKPLALVVQSTSAAGKSTLQDAVLALVPPEHRIQYSAMTGQSVFYLGEQDLKHKILAIAEEEGAHHASYALKLLQSEGEVTIASTGKDDNGNLVTREYRVEGPVMLSMTTTAIDLDEELVNRCLVLTVNESRAQTQAIHTAQRQRRTLQGLQTKLDKEAVIATHHNAQRLLRPLAVINPYADQLTFLDHRTRTRRDHEKYLTLIDAIALLHQYQRPIRQLSINGESLEYIEVTKDDIALANHLAHEVLGHTLDELPPQTRNLLAAIQSWVKQACEQKNIRQADFRFTRKDLRRVTHWGHTQLKVHCHRLEEMEYLLVHRGGRGQAFEYELLYDGNPDDDRLHCLGLIDTSKLYDDKRSASDPHGSGIGRVQVGSVPEAGRPPETAANPHEPSSLAAVAEEDGENTVLSTVAAVAS